MNDRLQNLAMDKVKFMDKNNKIKYFEFATEKNDILERMYRKKGFVPVKTFYRKEA